MKRRNLLPSALMLLFSAVAIFTFHIATERLEKRDTPDWKEVPVYTYISPNVSLSSYDRHFREAADSIGYDWTLLAAIAFTESRFDSTVVSAAGAKGVMQVMPGTLRGLGIPDSLHADNRTNIMAAAGVLKILERYFRQVEDPAERIKFVLAAYNAGYGYIYDAMRLADKYGHNRHKWDASVDSFLIHMSHPKYYTDTLCRNGEFNGWRETLSFVKKVHRYWEKFSKIQQNYSDSIKEVILTDNTIRIMQ